MTPRIEASANIEGGWRGRSFKLGKFQEAVALLESAVAAQKIWNTEFEDAKYWIAKAIEHAQDVMAEGTDARSNHFSYTSGDARKDIGSAYSMNQAAPLNRRLKKLPKEDVTPSIQAYIETLDEITSVWELIKSVKPFIVKGRKPNPNAVPVEIDRKNTGTCAICMKNTKLDGADKLVHHGFTISNGVHYFGHREGSCFGVEYLPYEFSPEGNRAYRKVLKGMLENYEQALKNLQASPDTLLDLVREGAHYKEVTFHKGTPQYDKKLVERIREVENQIENCTESINWQQKMIDSWTLKALPYGR